VNLTAHVTYTVNGTTSGVFGGVVTFSDGGTTLDAVFIALGTGGTVTVPAALSAGTHNLTASYSGSPLFAPSVSSTVTVAVVTPPPPPAQGNVTSQVQMTLTPAPKKKKHKSRGFTETLTISNPGSQALQGPLSVVLEGLSKQIKVKGAHAVGKKKKKSPAIVIGGGLPANGRTSITLQFSGKPNHFTVVVFAGTPPS
jgi:hypothetical protein